MTKDSLLSFVESVTDGSRLRVETDLGGGFVRLQVSEAQRRQAKQDIRCVEDAVIELLRNARDAHAHTIFVASSKSGSTRTLTMLDDGDGVPLELWDTVFEPRVTSKLDTIHTDTWGVHGRGMALYSIRQNARVAEIVQSSVGEGSAFTFAFDLKDISERADQSSLPALIMHNDGLHLGSSPHNIVRVVSEFSLENPDACDVYIGSPIEIAASVYAYGKRLLHNTHPLHTPSIHHPLVQLSRTSDAQAFMLAAKELGLEMSARSAHRILQGDVKPLRPLITTLKRDEASFKKHDIDLTKDFRGLRIHKDDIADFQADLKKAFSELADRYYLESDVEPSVRVTHDAIQVSFPVCRL